MTDQKIMDAFVDQSLEIIRLKDANRELLTACKSLVGWLVVSDAKESAERHIQKALAVIAKAENKQ